MADSLTDPAHLRASAWLTVDLSALAENYRILRAKTTTGCRTAAMVKADGYGLGAAAVSTRLYDEDCRDFFVATLDESLSLRKNLSAGGRSDAFIGMLGGVIPEACADYEALEITPVLNSLHDIEVWRAHAQKAGKRLPAVLHIDTGMNRLGLRPEEARTLASDKSARDGIDLKLIMSHFACSDEKDHPMNEAQAQKFAQTAALFPGVPKSLANSSGVFRSSAYHHDMIRPGMALYGLNPVPELKNPMRPVAYLNARILQMRPVKAEETVGYSATHTFKRDSMIATLSVGYADGFLRSSSGRAVFYYKGAACPLRGRVSMDLVTVETGHLAQQPQPGDVMEILGEHQDADTLAATAGTIGYEILTSLGPRYYRVYKG